jgi:sugar lactone lactonase YvrE
MTLSADNALKAPEMLEPMEPIGQNLDRPEFVACTASGTLYATHRHGMTIIRAGGQTEIRWPETDGFMTNGFALLPDRRILLANLGSVGGVWQRLPDGRIEPFLLEVDGVKLPPVNYVGVDHAGRVWITVSTRRFPRDLAFHPDVADGFIVLADKRGARIAADGLAYTNEAHVDPSGKWLYVAETMARRISRFPLGHDNTLGEKSSVAQFGPGTFPDGFAFDSNGGIWVAAIVGNRLVYVAPDGSQTLILDDSDPGDMQRAEEAFLTGKFVRSHLETGSSRALRSISSVAFGGPDLRTLHLGSLAGTQILRYRVNTPGAEPAHWQWD